VEVHGDPVLVHCELSDKGTISRKLLKAAIIKVCTARDCQLQSVGALSGRDSRCLEPQTRKGLAHLSFIEFRKESVPNADCFELKEIPRELSRSLRSKSLDSMLRQILLC